MKISAATGALATAGLAFTGPSLAHYLVAAGTAAMMGVVLMQLVPRHES